MAACFRSSSPFCVGLNAHTMTTATATVVAEMKAGRLELVDGKRLVADGRKGVLQIVKESAAVARVVWRPRTSATAPAEFDSRIVLAGPVGASEACVEVLKGQRVVALRIAGQRVAFFWVQEPDPASDAALIAAMNAALIPVPLAKPDAPPVQLSVLQAIMRQLSESGGGEDDEDDGDIELMEVLRPADVVALLRAEPEIATALYPHMPESTRSGPGVETLLHSPQFRQAVAVFEAAIKSAEVGLLLAEFGIDQTAQGGYGGVTRFLQAMVARFSNHHHPNP
jgi:hypothetical protein